MVTPDGLHLPESAALYLQRAFPAGIYAHQAEAVGACMEGSNVCLSTGTASGKTLAFTLTAIHLLTNSSRRVLAIYPQRALGNQQEARWSQVLRDAGVNAAVGRVDGSVPVQQRPAIVRRSRVLVCTPDVMHAWLLSHLADAAVKEFVRAIGLVVVDEVHTYTGVLGSNAAFLFRRLQHAIRCLGGTVQFFTASATIQTPERHLTALFGREFVLIGPEKDTAPKHDVVVNLVAPPRAGDMLSEVSALLQELARDPQRRFVAFVDSRKQTEHIAAIAGRSTEADIEAEEGDDATDAWATLEGSAVLPYRAGYEERDRNTIERRLQGGALRGVVSTSALELGIDLPHLTTAVLIGVPRSATSLRQRIGRIGRASPGEVYVVNSGDLFDEAVFRHPETLLDRPLAESALYLENPRIQYIHALCLARTGGEHDAVCADELRVAMSEDRLDWPPGFCELCERERTGQIGADLQSIKAEAGDEPNYVYPLRDVENQFKVVVRSGPVQEGLGNLSYRQVLREAYPGAVYYYATRPYRVMGISLHTRQVTVRRERRYTTQPTTLPTLVYPNVTPGNVYSALRYEAMNVVESAVQVREAVAGFRERRGGAQVNYGYPLSGDPAGVYFQQQRFARNYFTSGVLIVHPLLSEQDVDVNVLAEHVFEALLMVAPYERADLGWAVDRLRATFGELPEGARFICVYDQTYGSLRLSGRLADTATLGRVLAQATELLGAAEGVKASQFTHQAARLLALRAMLEPRALSLGGGVIEMPQVEHRHLVVLPGSQGLDIKNGHQEFHVERILVHPQIGLAYRGRHDGLTTPAGQFENIPVDALTPIPGVSKLGYYDFETGDTTPL